MTAGQTFLIVERQALVQLDLSEAVLEIRPLAQILCASSISEVGPLLDDVSSLTGAIVSVDLIEFKRLGAARTIEALGAWIVCVNGRHTDEIVAEGWHPLAQPFFADDVRTLMLSLLGRQQPSQALS